MTDASATVYVVDDDPSVRTALQRLVAAAGLRVETFPSANAFLEHQRPDAPECLLLDVRMPGPDGLDLQEQLGEAGIDIPIVFLTGFGDVPTSVEAMKAGAVDFLTKPVDDDELLEAIDRAITQHSQIRREQQEIATLQARYETLTPRQREVFAYVVTGMLNKQIARELNVTVTTIKSHRAQVMRKMEAESLADLVRFAERLDLESPTE